jgi:sortase A
MERYRPRNPARNKVTQGRASPAIACGLVSDPSPMTRPRSAPRLWERLLATTGRVLVSSGLLLLAFVGYQLWGTGIEQSQRQGQLSSKFEQLLATTTTTKAPAPAPTTAPVSPDGAIPPTTTAAPEPVPVVVPDTGDPVARMVIPRLDVDQIVVMGVGTPELKMGPGHFPGTPLPGQLGNAAIAGHRTSYGAPFGDVDRLEVGDEIVVTTPSGDFRYLITGSEIVDPTAVYVIDTVDATVASLTLVTCHPRFSTRERLIVYAELDAAFEPLPAPTTTKPALRPTPVGSTLPGQVDAIDVETTPTLPTEVIQDADPFAAGWFDDDGAWWHVAGWGLLLSAIAVATTRVGQARNNQRFGAVIGLFPFLIVLYFFFQNVNRLLPPGL